MRYDVFIGMYDLVLVSYICRLSLDRFVCGSAAADIYIEPSFFAAAGLDVMKAPETLS